MGAVPNLVFILFFILIFFSCLPVNNKKPNQYLQEVFYTTILAGFLLDVFSPSADGLFFGLSIIFLLIIYFSTKIIIYFLKEMEDKYLILYFLSIFLFCFFIYNISLNLIFNSFDFNKNILIDNIYNLTLAYFGFYIYRKFYNLKLANGQLKLFD